MQHIHAKHPRHPVLVSVQPTTPDVGKPLEASWPLQQALNVKMEFDDVKQKPNTSNKAELKQCKKRLKEEMKQRGKVEKKQRKRYKRTSAEVSSEDKQLAEKAIKDLQAQGASTDDLTWRLCDPAKTFAAFGGLLCHYRSHAGHRPFKCDQCQATFTRQFSLKYHLMTHENWSRFTCTHCNRKFNHPSHFKNHVATKHGDVAKFECQFCDSVFLLPKEHQKHLKSKHKSIIMGNEMLLQTNKVFAGQILVKDKKKLEGKGKRVKDEEPDQSYLDEESDQSLSLKTEPEPGPDPGVGQARVCTLFNAGTK